MSKRKVKVRANKLDNVDVEYISLVPRGANQMPFRLLKSADPEKSPMIDLTRLFKSNPKEPRFGGVIVKTATADAWKAKLEKAGHGPLEAEETGTEGYTFLKTEGSVLGEGSAILKASEELALVVVDLEKGIVPQLYGDVPFKDATQSIGFMPSFHLATDVLVEKMYEVVNEPGDRETTLSKMDSLLKDYSKYVKNVAGALPVSIFKMDTLELDDEDLPSEANGSGETGKAPETTETKKTDESDTDSSTDATSGEDKESEDTESVGKVDDGSSEQAPAEVTETTEDKTGEALTAIQATLTALGDRMTALETGLSKAEKAREEVTAVKAQLQGFQTTLDGVTKTAASLHEAVTGQALNEPLSDDGKSDVSLTKNDDDVFFRALGDSGKGIECV
jgi:hypothetical protein